MRKYQESEVCPADPLAFVIAIASTLALQANDTDWRAFEALFYLKTKANQTKQAPGVMSIVLKAPPTT